MNRLRFIKLGEASLINWLNFVYKRESLSGSHIYTEHIIRRFTMNLIPLTLEELKTKLASSCDEVSLLEVLGINSFDLVEAFSDRIEENYDRLLREVMDSNEMEENGEE